MDDIRKKEVWTIQDVASYTGLSKSTIYKLTANKKIPHSKPSGKVIYFKKDDVINFLLSNPIATSADLEQQATDYCYSNKA